MSQKRVARTSMKQFEMLLNFMENHQQLVSGKLDVNFTIRDRQRLWEELSEKLNAAGNGSRKDAEKWRKTWIDWKSNAKAKSVSLKQAIARTGGGPPSDIKLSTLEERLLNLIGLVAVNGEPNLEEAGFQDQNTSDIVEPPPSFHDELQVDLEDFESGPSSEPITTTIASATVNRNSKKRRKEDIADILHVAEEEKISCFSRIASALETRAEVSIKHLELMERKVAALERKAIATERLVAVIENLIFMEKKL